MSAKKKNHTHFIPLKFSLRQEGDKRGETRAGEGPQVEVSSPVLLPSGSGAGQLSHSHRTDRPHGSPAGAGHVLSSRLPIQLFKSSTPTRLLSTFPGSENSFTDQTRDFIYQLGPCQPLCLPVSSVQSLSRVRFFATPWTAACQASLPFAIFLKLAQTHVH